MLNSNRKSSEIGATTCHYGRSANRTRLGRSQPQSQPGFTPGNAFKLQLCLTNGCDIVWRPRCFLSLREYLPLRCFSLQMLLLCMQSRSKPRPLPAKRDSAQEPCDSQTSSQDPVQLKACQVHLCRVAFSGLGSWVSWVVWCFWVPFFGFPVTCICMSPHAKAGVNLSCPPVTSICMSPHE